MDLKGFFICIAEATQGEVMLTRDVILSLAIDEIKHANNMTFSILSRTKKYFLTSTHDCDKSAVQTKNAVCAFIKHCRYN